MRLVITIIRACLTVAGALQFTHEQAESVKSTNLNVVLGFLSVLLGYLSLDSEICALWADITCTKASGLDSVIGSIRRFLDIHNRVRGYEGRADISIRLQTLIETLQTLGQSV
jgi:hypothetical protein